MQVAVLGPVVNAWRCNLLLLQLLFMLLLLLLLRLLLLWLLFLSQICTGLTCSGANADSGQLPSMERIPSAAAACASSSAASPAADSAAHAFRSSAVADAVHMTVTQLPLETATDAAPGSCTASAAAETDVPPSALHFSSPFASSVAQAGRKAEQPWQIGSAAPQQPPDSSCGVSSSEDDHAYPLDAGGLDVSRQAELQAGRKSMYMPIMQP